MKILKKLKKLKKNEKNEKIYFFYIFWIISYKFGAYIKIFRSTFLTTWHYL